MKNLYTLFAAFIPFTGLFAQPVINSTDLQTGCSFNLYSLSNVNTANLMPSGANVTWDLSNTTAVLTGTADFQEMSDTPFEAEYPEANFAMKFTPTGLPSNYSLFNHTATILEEVANNVGTANAVSFLNYRTTMVFPFTFGLENTDLYQKENQEVKTISNTYDAYGTFITPDSVNMNIVRIYTDDNENIAPAWWSTSPLVPLFRANSDGFILWQITSTTTGVREVFSNSLFDMYPNPATTELHILNKKLISGIEIYNSGGELQFTTTLSVIDISALAKGVYILKAFSPAGTVSQKFIKK